MISAANSLIRGCTFDSLFLFTGPITLFLFSPLGFPQFLHAQAILHPSFAFRQGHLDLLLRSTHARNFGSLFTLSSPHRHDNSAGILVLLPLIVALFARLLHLQSLSQERSLCIQGQRLPGRQDDLLSVLFFPQEHPFPFVLGDSSLSAY